MKKLIELIDQFYDSDREYYQTLMTIFQCLADLDRSEFYKMLLNAQENGFKVKIKESDLPDIWDSLELKDIYI